MNDKDRKKLLDIHMVVRYGNKPCPHCGVTITGKEPDLINSAGGTYLQEYGVAAHAACYYVHEANEEWRKKHPQYAPKTN